jgi:hypothetical protein
MAERLTLAFNGYFCQKLQRRRWRSPTNARQSRREEEKLGKVSCAAMAEQTTSALNGYFCQKLQRRRWCNSTNARLSFLEADISPKYLRIPPLSFQAQRLFLTPPGRELDLWHPVPKHRKL